MRATLSMPSLFLGATPASARAYLHRVFVGARATYPRVVVPCAGRFSGPLMAIRAGYRPEQIATSDIGLFSNLIGALASGQDPRALGAVVNATLLPNLAAAMAIEVDPVRYAALVLLALKMAQTPPKHAYLQMIAEDLREGWRRHLDALATSLAALVTPLRGLSYRVADVRDILRETANDPGAILYVDPPGFAGGYKKQGDGGALLTYPRPDVAQFDPRTGFSEVRALAHVSAALVLTLQAGESMGDDAARAVWAEETKSGIKWLTANRKAPAAALAGGIAVTIRGRQSVAPGHAVWGDATDRIRADSVLQIAKTTREVGLYYRDLFAHTLGQTDTQVFYLVILDGKVFGTVGMDLMNARLNKPYPGDEGLMAWESFGFSSRHVRYPRHLNRLLMMAVTCAQFLTVLKAGGRFPAGDPIGIRTACITKGHESKGNRGILKLRAREPRPDGRFHLVYSTPWRPGTFADQVRAWVAKYGSQYDAAPEPAEAADA